MGFPNANIDQLTDGSPERESFVSDFKSQMAQKIGGVTAEDITVISIEAGSVVVIFRVAFTDSSENDALAVVQAARDAGGTVVAGGLTSDDLTQMAAPSSVTT